MMKIKNHYHFKLDSKIVKKIHKEVSGLISYQSEYDHYLVNGSVNVIPLVSPGGKRNRLSGFSNGPSFKNCPTLNRCPEIKKFLDSVPGKKLSCRISIMEKETEIFPHRDYFRSLEFGVVRLHVPIVTDPKITFSIENKSYHLSSGYLHYVDISKVHFLINPAQKKRVHLIIDLEVTEELLRLFGIHKIKKELEYLNLPHLKTWYDLSEMSFELPRDKIPYPLSLNSEKWLLSKIKGKWFLVASKYKYLLVAKKTGHYYLDSVGPGFYFTVRKKSLCFTCSGITSIAKNEIINQSKSFVVKSKKAFREIPPVFRRSLDFIQVKHFSDELLLVKKDDPSLLYFLNGQSKELWSQKEFICKNRQELKEAQIMSKLGVLERVHPCHAFPY